MKGVNSSYVNTLGVSPDGTRIASGNWNSSVNLWETRPVSIRNQESVTTAFHS